MKIAFVLFDGITFLDLIGFYDVITRLKYFEPTKDSTWDLCGLKEEITDELGMRIKVNVVNPDLSKYDMLFVPGGLGTRALRFDEDFIDWLKKAQNVEYKISVCTGSLLLGAAGFLQNKKATTHPFCYELLEPYCTEVIKTRIVRDGNVITGGGVATSIDLGLYVIEQFLGNEEIDNIKKQMDYPYTHVGIIEG
ncbi:DJ-1/PfpI family protein [Paenibacillus sp. CAU 1782]